MSSRISVARLQRRAKLARIGVFVVPVLASMVFGAYLNALGVFRSAAAPVAQNVVKTPNQISTENTRVAGSGENQQRFEVVAGSGLQDKDQETLVHLKTVSGMFQRPEGGQLSVNANRARFDGETRSLELEGNVVFDEAGRFRAAMDGASVDTNNQTLVSKSPVLVTVTVVGGTITADKFMVMGKGQRMLFQGSVKASFVGEAPTIGVVEP